MIDLEDKLRSLPAVAERFAVPVETLMARAHRRVVRRRLGRAALAVVLATAGIGATIAVTRSHPKEAVSVQPTTGTISRADAIAALRTAPGYIAPTAVLTAKLISLDDYTYALNNGNAPTTRIVLQPSLAPITSKTPIWLIYIRGANTIALGHGPPAAWALVFVDANTAKIAYRVSDTGPAWPYWALLPDRAGPGNRAAFCAVAHQTLADNANVPSLTPQPQFKRTSAQIERLLAVAPPQPRNDLTTMRSYLKTEINHTPPSITYRNEAAANIDFDNNVRHECGIDLGTESILGNNSHASSGSSPSLGSSRADILRRCAPTSTGYTFSVDVDGDHRPDRVYYRYYPDGVRLGVCTASGAVSEIAGLPGQAESIAAIQMRDRSTPVLMVGGTSVNALYVSPYVMDAGALHQISQPDGRPIDLTEGGNGAYPYRHGYFFGCDPVGSHPAFEQVEITKRPSGLIGWKRITYILSGLNATTDTTHGTIDPYHTPLRTLASACTTIPALGNDLTFNSIPPLTG